MEKYRSGHNERDSKSCCPQGHVGSNPTFSAIWAMRARKSRKPLALIVWSSWLTYLFGGVAQLGEHLLHTQGVTGSSPAVSTTSEQSSLCSVFLCKKNIRPLPYSSSSAKSHACSVYSPVNVLATTPLRYQLFAVCACGAFIVSWNSYLVGASTSR